LVSEEALVSEEYFLVSEESFLVSTSFFNRMGYNGEVNRKLCIHIPYIPLPVWILGMGHAAMISIGMAGPRLNMEQITIK
jgi:hypothetical protein